MPVFTSKKLKSIPLLKSENIKLYNNFFKGKNCINLGVLNLMPNKIETEKQLIKLMTFKELNINIFFIRTETYKPKNISQTYLQKNYYSFDEAKKKKLDALIITGAPLGFISVSKIIYWNEFTEILNWTLSSGINTFLICWAAIVVLEQFYNVPKIILDKKISGIHAHKHIQKSNILKNIPNPADFPVSRSTGADFSAANKNKNLKICLGSEKLGAAVLEDCEKKRIFALSHLEYDTETLANEYFRDAKKGISPKIPYNYFPENSPAEIPRNTWSANSKLLFKNWLNIILKK